jgi:hypothetical protein
MLLKIVSPRYDPFWDGNSGSIDETELFQITSFDSLRLDGVTYTEQEARQITVSDVSINSPLLASYGVTSPTPLNSKLSKYLFIRVLIYDDNDQIYIDGAINRNSFKYFPATDTYTFTITDMLGVLIDWLGEREIEVDDFTVGRNYGNGNFRRVNFHSEKFGLIVPVEFIPRTDEVEEPDEFI